MKIEKIINNNIVSARDEDGSELIVMGRGLGFQKKAGQTIDQGQVEKVFRMDLERGEQFQKLIQHMPMEHVQIVADVIAYATQKLDLHIGQMAYLTITDHLSFVIGQCRKGRIFPNALHTEVRRFHAKEYLAGLYALELVKEKTGLTLPDDEAASIAMHLVNAEYDVDVKATMDMTMMMQGMLDRILEALQIREPEEGELNRLTVSLKELAHRMLFLPKPAELPDMCLWDFLKSHYQTEYDLSVNVRDYLNTAYGCEMTDVECMYLLLSIKRINDFHRKK